ncbi:MAG: DMT family transporter, partial [Pseudomonadota bacterium]
MSGAPGAAAGIDASRTALLTVVAMIAFAANSLLTRAALGEGAIDAAGFTALRAVSGAVTLVLILRLRARPADTPPPSPLSAGDWVMAAALFVYMAFFSFAYLSLSTGTGALVLFGAVQITMFAAALRAGERFAMAGWAGLALALAGLVYLVSPGLTAPDPLGAALMAVAGLAWGVYSLRGRGVADPLAASAGNFLRIVPFCLALCLPFFAGLSADPAGLALAVASGAVASGLGYVIWYAALPGLTAGRAATVQLSVPVIAAFAGVVLLDEAVTLRLVL